MTEQPISIESLADRTGWDRIDRHHGNADHTYSQQTALHVSLPEPYHTRPCLWSQRVDRLQRQRSQREVLWRIHG